MTKLAEVLNHQKGFSYDTFTKLPRSNNGENLKGFYL
jgi:hypothetical protein